MSFEELVAKFGYWAAVRMMLTFIGVDFTSAVDDSNSISIKSPDGRFVVWHNDQGANELDLGIRYMVVQGCDDLRLSKGIHETFELLCSIRDLVEGKITFDQIVDHYS